MYEEHTSAVRHVAPRPAAKHEGAQPALLALASAILPGLGQLIIGLRRRGLILMGITFAMLAVAGGFWFGNKLWVLTLSVRPAALLWLLVLNALLLGFRIYAAVDAYIAAGGQVGQRHGAPIAAGGALVMLAVAGVLLIPHATAAYYDLVQYDLITTIFGDDDPVVAVDDPTETTEPGEGDPGEGVVLAGGTTSTSSSTTTSSTTTTTMPAPWEGVGRYNVLLIGGDAGPGRRGLRTDTMVVASIDMDTGWTAMFQIPRNLAEIPMPASVDAFECQCFPRIANEIYDFGTNNPEYYAGARDPGARALTTTLGELLGIPIHNYALVNLNGFVDVVDALGGVTINVTRAVYDEAYPHEDGSTVVIDIPVGIQEMDGHTALAYARSRRQSDDYNRMGRQRCVLEALAEGADPAGLLLNFPRLAGVLKEVVNTDIPIDQLPDLVKVATKINTDEIVSIQFIPPTYNDGRTADRFPKPAVPLIREHVETAISLPPLEAIATLGLEPLTDACG